jgi:hypothetical protein
MTEERRGRTLPGDLPAFPNDTDPSGYGFEFGLGMSKREHFAVLLLAGMNANPDRAAASLVMVTDAINQADLLIEALAEADREDS